MSEVCDKTLPYSTLEEVRQGMVRTNEVFEYLDQTEPAGWESLEAPGKLSSAKIESWSGNFYMTDPISRHSVTMAKCSQEIGTTRKLIGDANVA
jgi:NADH-quinone oxidoreductase subunit G